MGSTEARVVVARRAMGRVEGGYVGDRVSQSGGEPYTRGG